MWVVVGQDEMTPIYHGLERRTRSEAIAAFMAAKDARGYKNHNWSYYPRSFGYSCKRVSDVEAKKKIMSED